MVTNHMLETILHGAPRQLDVEGKKRSSVAIVLRIPGHVNFPSVEQWIKSASPTDLEVLFIKRSVSEKDRWSGHIALPGGKHELGETDEQTAAREAHEEVGIDLNRDGFLVGGLDQRLLRVSWGRRIAMVLCPYVYVLNADVQLAPQWSEVSSAFWYPFMDLLDPQRQSAHTVPIGDRLNLAWMGPAKPLVSKQLGSLRFAAVDLDPKHEVTQHKMPRPYHLWGVTLGVFSDLFEMQSPGHFSRYTWLPTMEAWDMRLWIYLLNFRASKTRMQSISADIQNGLRGGKMDLLNRYLAGHFNFFPLAIGLAISLRLVGVVGVLYLLAKRLRA